MSQPIRPARLLIYVCFLLLALLTLYVPMQVSVAVYVRYQVQLSLDVQQAQVPGIVRGLQSDINAASNPDPNLRPLQSISQMQQHLTLWQQQQANPPYITISYFGAVMEALLNPLGNSSRGSIAYPTSGNAYFPPRMLWNIALSSGAGGWTSIGPIWTRETRECLKWLYFTLTLLMLMPLSLALLPVSRRMARVRVGHIIRPAMYSLFIPFTAIVLSAILFNLGFWFRSVSFDCIDWMRRMLQIGPPAMIFIWWTAVVGRYFRLAHAPLMVLMLMLLNALLIITVAWLIDPVFVLKAIM